MNDDPTRRVLERFHEAGIGVVSTTEDTTLRRAAGESVGGESVGGEATSGEHQTG